jgi:hypothetical protein
MATWRDFILKEFVPNVSKLTLVADPDGLLTEEKLVIELAQRGFELLEFTDPVEFRYVYELNYRSIWDKGENTDLVIILRLQNNELVSLPYDLLHKGRRLAFDLGALFPNLSYPVLEQFDRGMLDLLFEAQTQFSPVRLGDKATKDFMLKHVFNIETDLLTTEVAFLRILLRLHYNKIELPTLLAEHLIQVLREYNCFKYWPLAEVVPDARAFFDFLQERWPLFLAHFSQDNAVSEETHSMQLTYSGPTFLPFDHEDIRVYIDNLFVEGKLKPVLAPKSFMHSALWLKSGLLEPGPEEDKKRLTRLFQHLQEHIPTKSCRHSAWLDFAQKYAELAAQVHFGADIVAKAKLKKLSLECNVIFAQWLKTNYAGLINLPPSTPAMLHHVPRHLARQFEVNKTSKIALVVVDGLALDQWVTLRQLLQEQLSQVTIKESVTFAWIPTLTSVSRQTIFSGKIPRNFPLSINTTNNEAKLWRQFWEDFGFSRLDIVYQRGLGDGDIETVLDANLNPSKTKVVGLVVDKVDKIMHGMQLGSAGMHNQIKQWTQTGYLSSLLNYLLEHGYQVWLTSDHGNIECEGRGRPSEGVIAELKGERVRVYPTAELRTQAATSLNFAREWEPIGLPPQYYPLIASGHEAFINPSEQIVGHGGIAFEEVLVPLIKFERKLH